MEKNTKEFTAENFKEFIDILSATMDHYLYIYDLQNDYYCISEHAKERFHVEEREFYHVLEVFEDMVYPADIPLIQEDLKKITLGEKDFHNLQYRWKDKNGRAVWINCRGQVLNDKHGKPEFLIGCINEIGNKQKADNISGLLGEASLRQELLRHEGKCNRGFLLRLGLDNFREINENKGMQYGDMILHKTAECMRYVISPEQKLYRMISDEFIIMDFKEQDIYAAHVLYERIKEQINRFIENNNYEVFFTISGGILDLSSIGKWTCADLLKWSEFSLSQAKRKGKNTYSLYNKLDYMEFSRKRELLAIMRQSINENFEGFETHFQVIVDIQTKKLYSAETLLRFSLKNGQMVSPIEFIPLLEESGLIVPVGKWVLEQALAACARLQKIAPDFKIAVNLSYIQVLRSDVLKDIVNGVQQYGLEKQSLVIELTESGFLEADANFINFCEGLKEHDILLALDDFGTGYSNFHYLYNLTPNTLKIDRNFTVKALTNEYEYNLLHHMAEMAHGMNLKICIEGIETEEELKKICGIKPDFIQGYYFGKPCKLEKFMEDFTKFI